MKYLGKHQQSAITLLLSALLGISTGLLLVRELHAATPSNCYEWRFCSAPGGGSGWCKDADEHVGGCFDGQGGCESPCP